jgi:hypothetical protein
LGERLAVPSAVRPASLAMTGGLPMQLLGLAALLISGGLLAKWAGRTQEKWLS